MIYLIITLFLVILISYACFCFKHDCVVISGFPGIGKTSLFNNSKGLVVSDSDSSKFDKSYFPFNYISHIKDIMNYKDVILVSSHKIVRDALVKENIPHFVVYPCRSRKQEFLRNYKKRGNDQKFIDFMDQNWDKFIDEIEEEKRSNHNTYYIELCENEFLQDVISIIK